MAATHVNHMQKALDQMNLQLHHVISDITGQTGLAIVDAILGGERNPQVLAKLRHERIKASEEVIAKSLVGDYRPEHLFTLRQSLIAYRSYQKLIEDCECEIRRGLEQFHPPDSPPASTSESATASPPTKTRSARESCGRNCSAPLGSISPKFQASAPASRKPFSEKSARTSPSSGVLPRLPPGMEGKCYGWGRAR